MPNEGGCVRVQSGSLWPVTEQVMYEADERGRDVENVSLLKPDVNIVLKAEQKLMKFTLTKRPGVSRRWTRVWRRHAIASSVPLLSIEANWCGSRCGLTTGRMAFSASPSRHFAFMELRAAGW